MDEQTILDFQKEYDSACAPALPARFSDYTFISCLLDDEWRKVWLLKDIGGKVVVCKYGQGEYIAMLRIEHDMDSLCRTNGKFSFFPYIIDYYETEQEAYLLREYIPGSTLEELVEKHGPMSRAQALPIMQKLCAHLMQLHHSPPPIIYRDMKASNVVLTKNGDCYLIDMGATRMFHEGSETDTAIVGSQATAAPEQFGARQTDARTDIYALGILYAYLLTGELKKNGDPPKLPNARCSAAIQKATAFDPDNRYQTVEEFLKAISRPALHFGKKTAALCLALALLATGLVLLSSSIPHGAPGTGTADSEVADTDDKTVAFDSYLMQEAVTTALGKSIDETVTYEELKQITGLYVCGTVVFTDESTHHVSPLEHSFEPNLATRNETQGNIEDIALLASMPNLRELVLDNQNISDLSPLAGLPLTSVSLCGNPLKDLSPLAGCGTLRALLVSDTQVSDLSPLADCSIEELNITRTRVTRIAPVCHNPIGKLSIADIILEDYDQLKRMPIWRIWCKNLPREAYAPIAEIETLDGITIYDTGITSLEELAMFQQISVLDLSCSGITSLKGIDRFPNLRELMLNSCPLHDISDIRGAVQLNCLSICGNIVEDYTPLLDYPRLKDLSLHQQQCQKLYEQIPNPAFSVTTL